MGQKQSYSLTTDFDNKEIIDGEVAQTFSTAEPTPVSLRPVASTRTKVDQVAVKHIEENVPVPSPQVEPCVEIDSSLVPVHLEKLQVEPEMPHCIFILDKENADPRLKQEAKEEAAHFAQSDGLLSRQLELSELPGNSWPIKTKSHEDLACLEPEPTKTVDSILYEKLEYGRHEIVAQLFEADSSTLTSKDSAISITEIKQTILDPDVELYLTRTAEFNES
ncbi:hypothetical protein M3Y97_00389400 [Aphelenchoides bicaudatus]|nr:hypothetical protein M3Y97_00389400 [Aphelenchoides bicaudatus]